MVMATVQDVRNVDMANSLINVIASSIQCVLDDQVPCYVDEGQWGTCAILAESLVAAHLVTVAFQGSTRAAGPVTSESAGGVSRSFASPTVSSGSSFWVSTGFGQRYEQLKRTRITSPIVLCPREVVTNVA